MAAPISISAVTDDADPEFGATREAVLNWLDDHGKTAGVVFAAKPFALFARQDGRPVGGLVGSTNLGWLHVQLLAVAPDARRLGVGRRLLDRAEALARERGCHGAWLDTYNHQGPDYYPRLGWIQFGELPDFPMGGCRRFYRKAL